MADYSVNATSLSAPQGAGAQVVEPVKPLAPSPFLETLGNIFAKGLQADAKAQAEALKNNVIQGYVRVETSLNDAVATGQMSPAEAASRSRANFNKYAASYSEYITDFEKAGKALRGFTESGEVQDQLTREKNIRNADIDEARKAGFTFLPGMSKSAEDDQINAHKVAIRSQQALEQQYKANQEARAQGTYNQAVADRENKDLSFRLVNDIAGANLQAFQSYTVTLGQQVRSGKLSPEMAQAALNERFTNISASLQAAARTNPELAAPYRSLFEQVNNVGKQLLDPKNQADDLENQLKIIQTRMKLVAMTNPKIAATVVANQLLPNNAELALSSSGAGIEAISLLSNTPITDNQKILPQVAGNPDVEPDVLKMLKGGLNDLKSGNIPQKDIAEVQASNSVNQILKQTGELLNRGAGPTQLKGLAAFFSSPEYASFVTNGKIDKAAAGTAKKTFQLIYEPTVIKGVQQKLDEYVYGQASFGQKQADPVKLAETIDVKFTGSGVVFEAKPNAKLDPIERASREQSISNLQTAQKAINQLIHMGAHMEGSTDYRKYWEDNKHIFLPQIFPDPKRLKPGDVVDGYKYKGGAANDPRNWEPAGG